MVLQVVVALDAYLLAAFVVELADFGEEGARVVYEGPAQQVVVALPVQQTDFLGLLVGGAAHYKYNNLRRLALEVVQVGGGVLGLLQLADVKLVDQAHNLGLVLRVYVRYVLEHLLEDALGFIQQILVEEQVAAALAPAGVLDRLVDEVQHVLADAALAQSILHLLNVCIVFVAQSVHNN